MKALLGLLIYLLFRGSLASSRSLKQENHISGSTKFHAADSEVSLPKARVLADDLEVPISFATAYSDSSMAYEEINRGKLDIPSKHWQSLDSVRHFHPSANVVLISDNTSSLEDYWLKETKAKVFYVPTETLTRVGRGIFFRFEAWTAFIQSAIESKSTNNIVLIDSGILAVKDLTHVFKLDFKGDWVVGLTYRNASRYPLKSGIIFVNGKRLKEALGFFQNVVRLSGGQSNRPLQWYSEMQLLVQAVDLQKLGKGTADGTYITKGLSDTKVLLLPSYKYNWRPWKHQATDVNADEVCVVNMRMVHKILGWRLWKLVKSGKSLSSVLSDLRMKSRTSSSLLPINLSRPRVTPFGGGARKRRNFDSATGRFHRRTYHES